MTRSLVAVLAVLVTAAPAMAQPRRVAVLDFVNTSKDPAVEWLGAAAADDVTTRLHAIRSLQLLERSQLYRVLQEQRLNLSDLVDPSHAVKVGRLLGAEQMVVGGYTVFGGAVPFNVRFVDVATGAIVATSQVSGVLDPRNPGALWTVLRHLAQATIDSLNTRVAIVQGTLRPVPAPPAQRIEPTADERARLVKATAGSLEAQEAYGRGLVAYRSHRWAEAAQEFERATRLDARYASAWLDLGVVLEALGRWPAALAAFETASRLAVAAGDAPKQAAILNNIGVVHWSQGSYAEALGFYERSLRLAEKLGNEPGQAQTLIGIGNVRQLQGRYAEALGFYERSLRLEEKLGNEPGQAGTLTNIGNVEARQGRDAEALGFYERTLRLQEKLGDEPGQAGTLNNIGVMHRRQRRYAEALGFYERTLRLQEKLGDEPGQAKTLNNIGVVYEQQGRYAGALGFYERSLRVAEKLGDEPGRASTLHNIGLVHARQGHYAEALGVVERALAISERLGMAERDQIRRTRDLIRTLIR